MNALVSGDGDKYDANSVSQTNCASLDTPNGRLNFFSGIITLAENILYGIVLVIE